MPKQFKKLADLQKDHIPSNPICPYCGAESELVDSKEVYKRSYGPIYLCRPCHAWVGCHPGTTKPLGRLADAKLRNLKKRAHAHFDPMWRRTAEVEKMKKSKARRKAYEWLAKEMNLHPDDCHIGMFNEEQCLQVIKLCMANVRST